MRSGFELNCVLFDLDGTLVDTAPDLISALNHVFIQHNWPSFDIEEILPAISFGIKAMITQCLPITLNETELSALTEEVLAHYAQNIAQHSNLYPGMAAVLKQVEASGLKWGIVTNKRERFTWPLLRALKLDQRPACVISGDTAAYPKPHSAPMIMACELAKVKAENCVYIGDARHDIEAGKNVGMKTLVATYGYIHPNDAPESWGADALLASPLHLSYWLDTVICH